MHKGAARLGLLMGLLLGAVYTQLRSKLRASQRRRDLLQFGAATGEIEMQASLEDAKAQARERLPAD